jgi:hypothetical protein
VSKQRSSPQVGTLDVRTESPKTTQSTLRASAEAQPEKAHFQPPKVAPMHAASIMSSGKRRFNFSRCRQGSLPNHPVVRERQLRVHAAYATLL